MQIRSVVAVLAVCTALAGSAGCDPSTGRPQAAGPAGGGTAAPAAPAGPSAATATVAPDSNPLAGRAFYLDPANPAAAQATRWDAAGRAVDAAKVRRIGGQPVAHWLTAGTDSTNAVDAVTTRAGAQGQLPVLVAYNIPGRDCGSYSAGGAASAGAYRSWIRSVAAGIGGRPALVVLEPDALADALEGCDRSADERLALLADAVDVLTASPQTLVYIDAGHPGWVADVAKLSAALRRAGVDRAAGFALNVSNFVRTEDNLAYGDRISRALGGAHYIVDTSRNGAGPYPGSSVDGAPAWCNPPGRALGAAPTTDPGHNRLDGLLWVKYPGESDGACRAGEPAAGRWWPEYALGLA